MPWVASWFFKVPVMPPGIWCSNNHRSNSLGTPSGNPAARATFSKCSATGGSRLRSMPCVWPAVSMLRSIASIDGNDEPFASGREQVCSTVTPWRIASRYSSGAMPLTLCE